MNIRIVPIWVEHLAHVLLHIHFGGIDLQSPKFERPKSVARNFEILAIKNDRRAFSLYTLRCAPSHGAL